MWLSDIGTGISQGSKSAGIGAAIGGGIGVWGLGGTACQLSRENVGLRL